jgi:DNA polymerase V
MTSLKIIDIRSCSYRLPILLSPTSRVPVGYESIPAFVVRHPCDTFGIRAHRGFEVYPRLHPEDLLIVDRAIQPSDGDFAIAVVDGEFVIKQVKSIADRLTVIPENSSDAPSCTHPEVELEVWGVLIKFIRNLRNPSLPAIA